MCRGTILSIVSHSPDRVSRRSSFTERPAAARNESSANSQDLGGPGRRMNKQVILLTDAQTAPAIEILESLSAAGISVFLDDLTGNQGRAEVRPGTSPYPLAVLYEIAPRANPHDLSLVVTRPKEL